VYMRLEREIARANASNALKRKLWMFQMIKDAIEQNEVERAEAFRFQIIHIHQVGSRIRLTCGFDYIEATYGIRKRVNTDDFARSPPFCFEREKAFRTSNIEHAHACQILRQSKIR